MWSPIDHDLLPVIHAVLVPDLSPDGPSIWVSWYGLAGAVVLQMSWTAGAVATVSAVHALPAEGAAAAASQEAVRQSWRF